MADDGLVFEQSADRTINIQGPGGIASDVTGTSAHRWHDRSAYRRQPRRWSRRPGLTISDASATYNCERHGIDLSQFLLWEDLLGWSAASQRPTTSQSLHRLQLESDVRGHAYGSGIVCAVCHGGCGRDFPRRTASRASRYVAHEAMK